MKNKVIECNHITHYYGERLIYRDLNFSVEKGKILGLLGKNGTGKTTIINILNGYLKPTSGTCSLFGEDCNRITPQTKARIGLLLEGHIQHSFFNIVQIEKFYSRYFPNWKREAYYELLTKTKVTAKQKISTMSCGQRSQVALGLLLAQDPDLLILDDFSMGLDPGYRRLFVEHLKEYALAEGKTVFLTSHIIQDMEMLIDDCLIMDYGKILLHKPTQEIITHFRKFNFDAEVADIPAIEGLWNIERVGAQWEAYSFLPFEEVRLLLLPFKATNIAERSISLEDAFIGLTGKY